MDRPNFHFRRREEKLDWKKLAALDVDQIAKTVDYKALQDSIRQITYCDAGKEFDSEAADPNLVKVFRMAQLIIEYLLQSQDFLANNLASVEERLNSTLEELESARQRSRRDQDELRELRKGLRAPASSTVMTLTGHQRCQFCQKVFINTTYLQSHMMRRHNHMVGKQMSNQTLSTVIQDQSSPAAAAALEAELEQVRRRLLVAEQQLREERRRVAALEQPGAGAYQPDEGTELAPYHHTIKEEPEPPPDEPEPAGSRQDSGSGSRHGSQQGSGGGSQQGSGGGSRHGSGSGSRQGSGGGSRQGSGGGSQHGSGGGSQQGSGGGSRHGSGGGSRQGSGRGSRQDSGGPSRQGSGSGGGGSQRGSGGGSAEQKDSRLAVLLEQQAAEIRQLREELERQRQTMPAAPAAPTLLGGAGAEPPAPAPEPVNRVEQEIQKQARRDVVALEGQMEAQERYWQERLSAMRQRHDAEVEGMRRMLNEKNAATRGSAEYVNLDSGAERSPQSQSPRLLRFVHRHQSPSPGPAAAPGPAGRGGRQRPRPCIAPQPRHGRSRSVSGCRRLKFADDEEECDDDDEPMVRAAPRQSLSTDALTRNGPAGGRPQVRQELESELSERLLELGIEPGTRRLSSGLMTDKMRHLQMTRQVLGFGDLRRQVDQDLNQRLTKFAALPSKRTSKLALFAKDIMQRGAEMSRSLVTLGTKSRPSCTSATVDAQLMKRMLAAEKASRPRAASDSPTSSRRRAPPGGPAADWPRDGADWPPPRQHSRYQATSYEEEEDFRPRHGGRKFKFKANASKHILERFTRRGQCQSSLIKSTTIHRVESGEGLDSDAGGRYEQLRDDRPPPGRRDSAASVQSRRPSAEVQPPVSRSGSGSGSGLQPAGPAEDGFVTPMSRPLSGDSARAAEPPESPPIPQIGSGSTTPKQDSFDTSEISNRTESSPPPAIPTIDPVDARPSGSANTLSTSQWNSAAAAADSSAADETETRTSHTTGSSSSDSDSDESDSEPAAPPGDA